MTKTVIPLFVTYMWYNPMREKKFRMPEYRNANVGLFEQTATTLCLVAVSTCLSSDANTTWCKGSNSEFLLILDYSVIPQFQCRPSFLNCDINFVSFRASFEYLYLAN